MKKLLFACLLLAGTSVYAQSVRGGLKGGVNITNFNGVDDDNYKTKALIGFHAGGYLNFGVGLFSVQPELLVSTGGATFEDRTTGAKEDFRLTYLTVPVMARLKSPGGFYVEAGPQVGFKLGEDYGDTEIGDFARNLDLSAGAGLGFQVGALGIGGRYLVGLSKVGDADFDQIDPDYKNGVIQVGVSIRL